MISFIIIGLNEGEKLKKCIASVKAFIDESRQWQKNFEIIYVDSRSTDNSVSIAKQFGALTYTVEGRRNAAIARNYGASRAKGEILFFIDGDMEINPVFAKKLFKDSGELYHPLINGYRIDYYYDNDGEFLYSNSKEVAMEIPQSDKKMITTGGLFIISKDIWEKVDGMDSRLDCFEDYDLAFRVYEKFNIKVLKRNAILAKHHTMAYTDKIRFKKLVLGRYFLYKGILYRKHLISLTVLVQLLKSDISILILLGLIFISVITGFYWLLYLYPVAQLLRLLFIKRTSEREYSLMRFIYAIIIDFKILVGLLIFYPKVKNDKL